MCNLYTQSKSVDEVARIFRQARMPLGFPEGAPNLSPRDIAITDPGVIVREANGGHELVVRRWSWPLANGKPLYNLRSEGRQFGAGRCLVLADGFYEFTAAADPGTKRKDRWLFTMAAAPIMAIAGMTRNHPGVGEAFTMLTAAPGPDVAPYHGRQIVLLPQERWAAWLDRSVPAEDLLRPLPAGTLNVRPAPR